MKTVVSCRRNTHFGGWLGAPCRLVVFFRAFLFRRGFCGLILWWVIRGVIRWVIRRAELRVTLRATLKVISQKIDEHLQKCHRGDLFETKCIEKCNKSARSPAANRQILCFVYTKPPFSQMPPDLKNCEFGSKSWFVERISAPEMQTWGRNCLKIGG